MKRFVALCLMAVAFATAPAFADWQKGLRAYLLDDYKTALRELQPLAEQGHADAQNFLGQMYYNGEGVSQNYSEAFKWYKLSAEQGESDSQFELAWMYDKGEGVPQNYKQAVKWYRLVAEGGNSAAQNNLGVMYDNGHGVLQNYARSHMWFNLAASNGSEKAAENRDNIAKRMTSAQIEKAQDLAEKCLASNYQGC